MLKNRLLFLGLLAVVCTKSFSGEAECRMPDFQYSGEELHTTEYKNWQYTDLPFMYIDVLEEYGWEKIGEENHLLIPDDLLEVGLNLLEHSAIVDVTDNPDFNGLLAGSASAKSYLCRIPLVSVGFEENQVYRCGEKVIVNTVMRGVFPKRHSAIIIACDAPIETLIHSHIQYDDMPEVTIPVETR